MPPTEKISDRIARIERENRDLKSAIARIESPVERSAKPRKTEGWAQIKATTADANVFDAVMVDIFDKTTAATPTARSASANIEVVTVNSATVAVNDIVKVSLERGVWTVVKIFSANYGQAYCTADVTTADATFSAKLFESYPDEDLSDPELTITVVNPLETKNGSTYGYELKQNDVIAVEQWIGGNWKIYDGPCRSDFTDTSNAPTGITLSNSSVDEDSPSEVVGTLSAVDADLPDDSHTFEIIGSDGGMEIVSDNILRVKTDAGLDSADSPVLLEILTTDAGGRSYQEAFEITVNSVTSTGRFALRSVDIVITTPPAQLTGVQTWTPYGLPEESIPNNFVWQVTGSDEMTASDTVEFLVKNRGGATLTISSISVTGDLFGSVNKSSTTIAAGAEETLIVTCLTGFTPSNARYLGQITFIHNGDEFGMASPFVYAMTHVAVGGGPAPA